MDEVLKDFLDKKVDAFNQPSFISTDPISVPHRFTMQQDIEIAGFFASIFAWGNRTIIIKKSVELMHLINLLSFLLTPFPFPIVLQCNRISK